ncbi:MAG: SLC13 family permease, partial [Dehalococcoidia bacterium]
GKSVEEAGLRNLQGVYLARLERGERVIAPVGPEEVLEGGDRLGFVGRADLVIDLQQMRGLRSSELHHASEFRDGAHGFYEAVVSSTSPLVGETLATADFREQYQAAVVAIHRAGERVKAKLGQVELHAGDTLLLLARKGFREQWKDRRDFLLVSELDGSMPVGTRKGLFVLATAGAVVALAALGILPILQGALLAAILMVMSGILTPNDAARSVDMNVVLLIAAAFGVGNAIQGSGLAGVLADGIVGVSLPLGPTAVLAAIVLCTLLLTELITNNAAAVLMFPVALAAAQASGGEPRAFAWAVALAASASFLTPVGYQTNTMVYGIGGYRFGDYFRIGLPITLTTVAAIVLLIGS